MTNVDQSLLQAIRVVVGEAVAPLGGKIDGLAGRVDGLAGQVDSLAGRVDRVEAEQQLQRELLYSIQENIDERCQRVDQLERRLAKIESASGSHE